MKTTLDHLPDSQQRALRAMTAVLSTGPGLDKLILFGSYARGDFTVDRQTGFVSDYDLLAVVDKPEQAEDPRWRQLEMQANKYTKQAPLTLLIHDGAHVNREIRRGHYFFVDIRKEGVLLHDRGGIELAKPKALSPAERLALVQEHYAQWYATASQFWHGVGFYMARGQLLPGAFLLHQSAERFFHTATLVFLAYKYRTHDLEKLIAECDALDPRIGAALPRASGQDEHLFELLRRAYIEARYNPKYRITRDELTELRRRVQLLAERVRQACAEHMATLCGAEAVGELMQPPEVGVLPVLPPMPQDLSDAAQVERWMQALIEASEERGEEREQRGREQGVVEGEQRGREQGDRERLISALLDVLSWRGVELTAAEHARIAQCMDPALLQCYWDRARTARTAAELFSEDEAG